MYLYKILFILLFNILTLSLIGQNKFPTAKDRSSGVIWNMSAGSIGYTFTSVGSRLNEGYGILTYNYKKTPINLVNESSKFKYVNNGRLYEAYGVEVGFIDNFYKKNDIAGFSSAGAFLEYSPSFKYQFQSFRNNQMQSIDTIKPLVFNVGIKVNIGVNYFIKKNVSIGVQNNLSVGFLSIENNKTNNQNKNSGTTFVFGFVNPTISIRIYQ